MKISPLIALETQKMTEPSSAPLHRNDTHQDQRALEIKKKSKALEAVFLTQLIKSMEKTIPDGMAGGKNSLSSMMFSSVLGDAMSQGGGIGLSKMIFESLSKMDSMPEMNHGRGAEYTQTMDLIQNINSWEGQDE